MAELRCAVLGSPIQHSLSPAMHRAAYRELGLSWRYDKIEVPAGELRRFVDGLDGSWRGLSVTMPLKREAAELASERSAEVDRTGVANTLIQEGGAWSALNTDIPGFQAALAEAGLSTAESMRLLGAGATAVSALEAVASMGCRRVELVARSVERSAAAVDKAKRLHLELSVVGFDEQFLGQSFDLVVSTVPAIAIAGREAALIGGAPVVFDAIYDPWPSPLAGVAEDSGARVVSGLDLLAHQAAFQIRAMTGHNVSVDVLRDAAVAELETSRDT